MLGEDNFEDSKDDDDDEEWEILSELRVDEFLIKFSVFERRRDEEECFRDDFKAFEQLTIFVSKSLLETFVQSFPMATWH